MLPVKRYCKVYLNQPERVYDSTLLYGQYLCLCLCILYVEWPARAEAGWSSIYDHFIADLTLPITRCLPPPEIFFGVTRRSLQITEGPEVRGRWHRQERGPSLVFTVFSVIRNTKIFVSRCLEAAGAQTRPHSPHNATIHPAIYFPAKYDLFELFMIFLFDHKVSFNWARSSSAWQTWQGPSSNSSFYCGPCCYLSRLPVTRLSSGWTQHVSRLTPGPPGELWPSWNLSGSDWHSGHMDGLTPKKLDPNKMLTQERLDKKVFPRGEILTHYSSSCSLMQCKNER